MKLLVYFLKIIKRSYKTMHDELKKLLMDVVYTCGSKDLM